jgi:tetratricopeptide (TPR) repeat protein
MPNEFEKAQRAYYAGRDRLAAGDSEDAIALLEQSAQIEPHLKTLEILGEAWLRLGQPKRAIVPLAAATTLNEQVRAPSLLAEALLALGDQLLAHRIAELALRREPNNKKAGAVREATRAEYERWAAK